MSALLELLAEAVVLIGRGPRWLVLIIAALFGIAVIAGTIYGIQALFGERT